MVNSRLILFFLLWRGRAWRRGFRRWVWRFLASTPWWALAWTTERERGGVALRCGFLLSSGLHVGFHVVLCASSSTWFIVVPRRVHFYRRGEMFHLPDLSFLSEAALLPCPLLPPLLSLPPAALLKTLADGPPSLVSPRQAQVQATQSALRGLVRFSPTTSSLRSYSMRC
jgi:hypothetical protein